MYKKILFIALIFLLSVNVFADRQVYVFLNDDQNNHLKIAQASVVDAQIEADTLLDVVEELPVFDREFSSTNGGLMTVTDEEYKRLQSDPRIKGIYTDIPVQALLTNTTILIGANQTWNISQYGTPLTGIGKTVCIVDTGINYSHSAFGSCTYTSNINDGSCPRVVGGYNFVSSNNDVMDDNGHGTHVAGIVAANDSTIKGVAPGAKLVILKVLDADGAGYNSDIVSAINWCVSNATRFNISAISLSLGSPSVGNFTTNCDDVDPTGMTAAINSATAANISVVIAAGNEGNATGILFPSCITNATAIVSSTKADVISSFSNRGLLATLAAPGSLITSADFDGTYVVSSGTSMATPHVSGAIAILREYFSLFGLNKTNAQIFTLLNSTGTRITDATTGYNYSRINVYTAIVNSSLNISISSTTVSSMYYRSNTTLDVTANISGTFFSNITANNVLLNCTSVSLGYTCMGTIIPAANISFNATGTYTNATANITGLTLDDTSPSINVISLTKNISQSYLAIAITVNASDAVGLRSVYANSQNLTLQSGLYVGNVTANTNITINATDLAGNSQVNYTAMSIDNTPPITNISVQLVNGSNVTVGTWYSQSILVNLSASDDTAIAAIQYRNATTGLWTNVTTTNFTISNLSNNTLQYRSIDTAGNAQLPQSYFFYYDNASPTIIQITPSSINTTNQSTVPIRIYVEDAKSGIGNVRVNYFGTNYTPTNIANYYELNVTITNASSIVINVTDRANNSVTTNVSVTIGKSVDLISVPVNGSLLANNTVVYFTLVNATAGNYSVAGTSGNFSASEFNITINGSGAVNIQVNSSSQQFNYTYTIDSTKPVATTTLTNASILNGSVIVTVNATDATGVANITLIFPTITYSSNTTNATFTLDTLRVGNGVKTPTIVVCDIFSNCRTYSYSLTVSNNVSVTLQPSNGIVFADETIYSNYLSYISGVNQTTKINLSLPNASAIAPVTPSLTSRDIIRIDINSTTVNSSTNSSGINGYLYLSDFTDYSRVRWWVNHSSTYEGPFLLNNITSDDTKVTYQINTSNFSTFIISQLVAVCSEGAISSSCDCGGTAYASGYCCSSSYSASACDASAGGAGGGGGGGGSGGGGGGIGVFSPIVGTSINYTLVLNNSNESIVLPLVAQTYELQFGTYTFNFSIVNNELVLPTKNASFAQTIIYTQNDVIFSFELINTTAFKITRKPFILTTQTTEQNQTNQTQQPSQVNTQEQTVPPAASNNMWIWIILLVLVICIILFYFYLREKKKRNISMYTTPMDSDMFRDIKP